MRNMHRLLAYCDLLGENTDAYVYNDVTGGIFSLPSLEAALQGT